MPDTFLPPLHLGIAHDLSSICQGIKLGQNDQLYQIHSGDKWKQQCHQL